MSCGNGSWRGSYRKKFDLLLQQPDDSAIFLKDSAFSSYTSHLGCYFPGTVALASKYFSRPHDLSLARELLSGCLDSYAFVSSTGLGPERSNIASDGAVESIDPAYKLRPEVVESLHVMYQITHEAAYRRKAWDIFESIKAHCQTSSGFSGLLSVESGEQDDAQPSFFIAETLKYLYLTMKGPSDVLDNFVFSTEGHLLTKEEKMCTIAPLEVHFPRPLLWQ